MRAPRPGVWGRRARGGAGAGVAGGTHQTAWRLPHHHHHHHRHAHRLARHPTKAIPLCHIKSNARFLLRMRSGRRDGMVLVAASPRREARRGAHIAAPPRTHLKLRGVCCLIRRVSSSVEVTSGWWRSASLGAHVLAFVWACCLGHRRSRAILFLHRRPENCFGGAEHVMARRGQQGRGKAPRRLCRRGQCSDQQGAPCLGRKYLTLGTYKEFIIFVS